MSDPETPVAKVLRVAMAMTGPQGPLPASCTYTLEQLRHVSWGFMTRAEQQRMMLLARHAIAELEKGPS